MLFGTYRGFTCRRRRITTLSSPIAGKRKALRHGQMDPALSSMIAKGAGENRGVTFHEPETPGSKRNRIVCSSLLVLIDFIAR